MDNGSPGFDSAGKAERFPSPESDAKAELYATFARVGHALANPLRLMLLDLLAQGELSVEALAAEAGARVGNTSAQLQVLRSCGLVSARRERAHVYYRLAGYDVANLVDLLREVANARLAETERAADKYLGAPGSLPSVDHEELADGLDTGEVFLIDVRPEREYAAGHIPGAISVPLDRLEAAMHSFPQDRTIIAYCRGRFCAFAPAAVRLLTSAGFSAATFSDGLPQWRKAGRPLAPAGGTTRA